MSGEVIESLSQQVEECTAELDKAGTDETKGLKSELTSLLDEVKQTDGNCVRIQKSIDGAQCDLLFLREQAAAAQRSRDEREKSIQKVRDEIESFEQKIKTYESSEAKKRDQVAALKAEKEELIEGINAGSGWRPEQEAKRNDFISKIEKERRELETARSQLDAVRSQVSSMETTVQKAESKRNEAFAEIDSIAAKIDVLRIDNVAAQQRKNSLEDSLQEAKSRVQDSEATLSEKEQVLQKEKEGFAVAERHLGNAKAKMESHMREHDALVSEAQSLSVKLQNQLQANTQLESENTMKRASVEDRKREADAILKDIANMKKQHELVAGKIRGVETERVGYEREMDDLKLEIDKIENAEIKLARKEAEAQKRRIEALEREAGILKRNLDLSQKGATRIYDLTKVNETTAKNLENELSGLVGIVSQHQKTIERLTEEQRKHDHDAEAASKRHGEALELLRREEDIVANLRKEAQDADARLKHKQHIYETIQIESHAESTDLVKNQEEMDRVKRQFHIVDRQINQLKEEITRTDNSLITEHYYHHKAENEVDTLKRDIARLHQQISNTELSIRKNDINIKKLCNIIDGADEEREKQSKEYCVIMGERDILGSQLVQRQDDLAKLHQTIKTQQASLHRGEVLYHEHTAKIATVSQEIEALVQEKATLDEKVCEHTELAKRCTALESVFLREQAKNKALSDELGRPINIHRWRHLESSDPARFASVLKMHKLQRKLVETADQIVEKDRLIQDKEGVYRELKSDLDRHPAAAELKKQLEVLTANLKEKSSQMKELDFELLISKRRVEELRQDLLDLENQRQGLKSEWLAKACHGEQ